MSNCWDQSGTLRPTNDLLLGEKCYVGEKRGVEKWCSGGERSYFVEKVSCLGCEVVFWEATFVVRGEQWHFAGENVIFEKNRCILGRN